MSGVVAFLGRLLRPSRDDRPADVLAVANAALDEIERRGGDANLIRLQRLIAISQLWSIALRGRPLFTGPMEAVDDRPYLTDVHSAFRRHGGRPISGRARMPELPSFEQPSDRDPDRLSVLHATIAAHAGHDGYRLGVFLSRVLEGCVARGVVDQRAAAARLLALAPQAVDRSG